MNDFITMKRSSLRDGIPTGKTRVIGVDPFAHEEFLVKDCDTPEEAFALADESNEERHGSMDEVYYVYNDKGDLIRDDQSVNDVGVSP